MKHRKNLHFIKIQIILYSLILCPDNREFTITLSKLGTVNSNSISKCGIGYVGTMCTVTTEGIEGIGCLNSLKTLPYSSYTICNIIYYNFDKISVLTLNHSMILVIKTVTRWCCNLGVINNTLALNILTIIEEVSTYSYRQLSRVITKLQQRALQIYQKDNFQM